MSKKTSTQNDTGINSQIKLSDDIAKKLSRKTSEEVGAPARRETALYIQRMTTDLCVMAANADLDFLVYLLDMARIEAHDRAEEKFEQADLD